MYTTTRKFVESCYGCFLSTTGTRKIKLGTYPVPKRPFAEIMMDLAENLNNVKGYQHLLVIQDLFSDFNCMRSNKSSLIRKSKDQILEYFPKSIEEMETMKEAIIRNRSTLITLETSKHENSFHSGESKVLVTELLKQRPLLRIMNDMKLISMLFVSSLMVSLRDSKRILVFSLTFEAQYILKLPYKSWRILKELISDQ
jgi:hypothetical protein